MPRVLTLQELSVGDEWLSLARTVTEADVAAFAGLSGDFNPIHVDHEFARKSPFRRPVAHGLLGMAIGSGLATTWPRVDTLALIAVLEWRFLEPVFVGDTLRMHTKVLFIEPRARGRRGVVTWLRRLINQHDKAVQEGTTQTMVRGTTGRTADAPSEAE